MMPNREPPPKTFEERVTSEFAADLQSVEDRLVADAGPPPDTKRLSEAEEDRLWAIRDEQVDNDTLAQQLMTTGVPQDQLPGLVIVKEFPEWAPIFGQATQSAETADQLARMAEFPYRWQLLADLEPTEMVAKADRLDVRYQKAMGSTMMMPMDLGAGAQTAMTPAPASQAAPSPAQQPVGVGGAPDAQPIAAPPGGFADIGMGVGG